MDDVLARALKAAKEARELGVTRLRVSPDGSVELELLPPEPSLPPATEAEMLAELEKLNRVPGQEVFDRVRRAKRAES